MCGIIGYTGKKDASDFIVKGLKYLEYRGYDSSGLAVLDNGKIEVLKKEGRISCLEKELFLNPKTGNLGIGHTRWATHGSPSDRNAHPFVSGGMKFAVVHNGIIENYLEIKEWLTSENVHFYSQTDSEVVAHLLEYFYKGGLKQAVLEAVSHLKGSFALGIISVYGPGTVFAVRKDNPLIVGLGFGENYICSDIVSLQRFTERVVVLDNMQIAEVKEDGLSVYDFNGNAAPYKVLNVDRGADEINVYESYMDKEIREIPRSLRDAVNKYRGMFEKLDLDYLKKVNRIYIVACGTAFHAGCVGGRMIRRLMPDIDVIAEVASEFRYDDFTIDDRTLTVCVSQSGETADTLSCIRLVHEKGGKVLCVCNVPTSSIVHESDFVLLTNAGPEVAVASTKAYNCQNAVLTLFALDLAYLRGAVEKEGYAKLYGELTRLHDLAAEILDLREKVAALAAGHYKRKSVFYIGRGLDYFTAMEGSLKLKEISYIHCEAYPAGELKHGTLALIESDVLVVALITQKELIEKMQSSLCEVKARGAVVVTVTPFTDNAALLSVSDTVLPIPETHPLLYPILSVIPAQLLAYYIARAKGCDIDKPRNLAKSVTVE